MKFFYLLLLVVLLGCDKKPTKTPSVSQLPTSVPTEAKQHAFWETELQPVLWKQLVDGNLPFPILNRRFTEAMQIISARYGGQTLKFSLSTNYHKLSRAIEGSSGQIEGRPTVHLYIPSIMDLFQKCERGGEQNWQKAFLNHVLVLCMHEMDHLVVETNTGKNAVDAEDEARVWAETLEHTIVPLIETYHQPILMTDATLYNAWVEAGRKNNSSWQIAIRKRYSEVDGKN